MSFRLAADRKGVIDLSEPSAWKMEKAHAEIFHDGEQLSDLLAPLDLGWKARTQAELALMADLHPLLTKRAGGREISGLSAYE